MITVKALGNIGKQLGNTVFKFDEASIPLSTIINILYKLDEKKANYSTILSEIIITVNGVAISKKIDEYVLTSEAEVTLIPISHGG